jgi:fibrillarin-like rRNA methylase
MSLNNVERSASEELGLDTLMRQPAISETKNTLTTRIRWLLANMKDFVILGTDNKALIELLGDTCKIKKYKVHVTSFVLKTIYNTAGPKQAPIASRFASSWALSLGTTHRGEATKARSCGVEAHV